MKVKAPIAGSSLNHAHVSEQAALFHAIKPLFANKPLLVVVNKTDVVALDALSSEDHATLDEMAAEAARASGALMNVKQV